MRRGVVICGAVMLALAHASSAAALVPAIGQVLTSCIPGNPNEDGWCAVKYFGVAGDEELRVSQPTPTTVVLTDSAGGVLVTDDPYCANSGMSTVICTPPEPRVGPAVYAGPGNDVIVIGHIDAGALRMPLLDGERGQDTLLGGPGNESFVGGPGDDRLYGRAGDDELVGGSGRDRMIGGDGNDLLYSVDDNGVQQADQVDCGAGIDLAHWDAPDVATDCEDSI